MYIETGRFKIDDNMEKATLNGNYEIKEINNEANLPPFDEVHQNIPVQSVYYKGNVLYRTDTENVTDLIKLFIKYTHDPCKDIEHELDFSISAKKQMMGGTICPTKKVLFSYKNKVFVAYGRYIFGYDKTYAKFKREVDFEEDSESETSNDEGLLNDSIEHKASVPFNDTIRNSLITNDKIILAIPKVEPDLYEIAAVGYSSHNSFIKMLKRQILLLSSSKVHGHEFLEYAANDICELLNENKVTSVLFVPYALSDYDAYLKKVETPFKKWGFFVEGVHKGNPLEAIQNAETIFVGGGNTFRLLKTLYDLNLVEAIRKRVLKDGIPYIGTSAGTNIATRSIHTTNDMPIVYPPTFEALNLVPFNINPHYLDTDSNSKHKGETREERILQYFEEKESNTVLGLREGATLHIKNNSAILKGVQGARLFIKGKDPQEIEVGSDLSYLLKEDNAN